MKRRFVLALGAASLLPRISFAESKVIRLVVPFPPGGATDITARVLAEAMGRVLGQTIVVDNRGGAGGSIGMTDLARAAPDGLTLGMATLSTHGVNPAVYKKLTYDPVKDFTPITEVVKAPGVLVVNSTLPVKSMEELLRYLRANPGQAKYASPGNGTIGHMWGELFKSTTKTSMVHIAYRGAGPALNDLLGGQVNLYFDQVASSLPHIKSGKLKALAVTWDKRLEILPDVPTYGELSMPANNDPSWFGLLAPGGLAATQASQLQQAVVAALKEPGVQEKLAAQGLYASGTKPTEFAAQIRKEIDKMKQVSEFAKIALD